MRRRSRAGGEPAKAQRRKTGARKSRITPKAVHPRSSSAAREETKVARLTRERDEALQQQTATADVLQGHQPLDIRSASGARHAGRIGGPAYARPTRAKSSGDRAAMLCRIVAAICAVARDEEPEAPFICVRDEILCRQSSAGRQGRSYSQMCIRPRIQIRRGPHLASFARCSASPSA